MDNNLGEIIGVIIVIGLIVLFWKYFLIVVGIVAVAIAVYFIVKGIKQEKAKGMMITDGYTKGDLDKYKEDIKTKIQDLRRYYYKMKDDEMRDKLDAVTNSFKDLMKTIEEEPAYFSIVRRFLNITMKSCDNILKQSAMIYTLDSPSESNIQALEDSKEGLDLISTATVNQINKLYDNNAVNIDIELAVLKKSLQAKGLLDNDNTKENIE